MAHCERCWRQVRTPQRTLRPNLDTWQGRYAAITARFPAWATDPLPRGPTPISDKEAKRER